MNAEGEPRRIPKPTLEQLAQQCQNAAEKLGKLSHGNNQDSLNEADSFKWVAKALGKLSSGNIEAKYTDNGERGGQLRSEFLGSVQVIRPAVKHLISTKGEEEALDEVFVVALIIELFEILHYVANRIKEWGPGSDRPWESERPLQVNHYLAGTGRLREATSKLTYAYYTALDIALADINEEEMPPLIAKAIDEVAYYLQEGIINSVPEALRQLRKDVAVLYNPKKS